MLRFRDNQNLSSLAACRVLKHIRSEVLKHESGHQCREITASVSRWQRHAPSMPLIEEEIGYLVKILDPSLLRKTFSSLVLRYPSDPETDFIWVLLSFET